MRKKKTGAETPKYRHPMPPPRPLPELDELSRESDSAPIYRKAMVGAKAGMRLINANEIKFHTIGAGGWSQPLEVAYDYEIDRIPTVDAVEAVHGRWVPLRNGDWTSVFECSQCHRRVTVGCDKDMAEGRVNTLYPFCHCGAKMDGKESAE